jgi:hypothetical protein
MNANKPRAPLAYEVPASDALLADILDKAVVIAQRNAGQFEKLAALARAIERTGGASRAHAKLLFSFEQIASSAQADAKLDMALFEGLRNGQILKQQLRNAHSERPEPMPGTSTRH